MSASPGVLAAADAMARVKPRERHAITLEPIEILALRKLHLVSVALAQRLSGSAGREQMALARVLGDVLDRAEIERSKETP